MHEYSVSLCRHNFTSKANSFHVSTHHLHNCLHVCEKEGAGHEDIDANWIQRYVSKATVL